MLVLLFLSEIAFAEQSKIRKTRVDGEDHANFAENKIAADGSSSPPARHYIRNHSSCGTEW
ncbi:hypothetical protein JCGZ_04869 [Jatropha curcas]|uniref:Uncharacterized protein n=1 Tax=Jatropha curcas TaxID=180498 RepID=A0A067KPW8_JATCU|nr:hypothetical protein JCGZ_04869 [Jatropha curcas]